MSMLSTHLVSSPKATDSLDNPSVSYMTGICFSVSLNPIFDFMNSWIVDTGATRHICCNANLFTSMRPIWNSMVTLPNNE